MNKVFVVLLLVVFVSCFGLSLVRGQTVYTIDSMYTDGNTGIYIKYIYSNNGTGNSAGLSQSFQVSGATRYLYDCGFKMEKVGSPVGVLKAILFNVSTFSDHDVIEYSSNSVSMADLAVSYDWANFQFSGTTTLLTGDQGYGIGVVIVSAETLTSSDYVQVEADDSVNPPNANGNMHNLYTGDWHYSIYYDLNFFVRGLDAPTATPTPTPTAVPSSPPAGTAVPSNTGDFGSSFYWIFIVLGSVVAFMFGLFALLGDKGNKAVNVLIAVVSLVVFVVVLFAIGVL